MALTSSVVVTGSPPFAGMTGQILLPLELSEPIPGFFGAGADLGLHLHRQNRASFAWRTYSMTSSATSSRSREISRFKDRAVLRFITSSYFVGSSTGRSAGFAPFKILPT